MGNRRSSSRNNNNNLPKSEASAGVCGSPFAFPVAAVAEEKAGEAFVPDDDIETDSRNTSESDLDDVVLDDEDEYDVEASGEYDVEASREYDEEASRSGSMTFMSA